MDTQFRLPSNLIALCIVLSAFLGTESAAATTFDVGPGDESAFFAAINAANDEITNPGPDIINLATSTNYIFTVAENLTDGANALPSVTSEITINGNGSQLRRSGQAGTPEFRFFHVIVGGKLFLQNMTFRNGRAPINGSGAARNGGAILNRGGVQVRAVELIGNIADIGAGGAICNTMSGDATIEDSTFIGNTCGAGGGALVNFGLMTAEFSSFTNNRARIGGAIANDKHMTVESCTLTNNQSLEGGGGIFNSDQLAVFNTTVEGSSAGFHGGGIYNSFSTTGMLTVDNSLIIRNTAGEFSFGGGIANFATIYLTNTTVSQNTTDEWGGGIVQLGGTMVLSNCSIAENSAGQARGGIYILQSDAVLMNTIVADNLPSDGDSQISDRGFNIIEDGIGITNTTSMSGDPLLAPLADNGGSTMTYALLPGSVAIDAGDCTGGLVTVDQRGYVRPQGAGCDIGAFEADAIPCQVPALLADGDEPGLIDAINCANATPGPDVITLAVDGTYTLASSINFRDGAGGLPSIMGDIAIHGNGSVIQRSPEPMTPEFRLMHVPFNGKLSIENTFIMNGAAQGAAEGGMGGGILTHGSVALVDSGVLQNSANNGGGIAIFGGALGLLNSSVVANSADDDGGGILSEGGHVTISDSSINGNSSNDVGGGLVNISSGSVMVLTNVEVEGNSAWFGGGISNIGTLSVTDSTVAGNTAIFLGGGISNSGELDVANTSILGNTSADGAGLSNSGELNLGASLISGNMAGDEGGALYNTGASTISRTTLSMNTGDDGGGILNNDGIINLIQCALDRNVGRFGGAVKNDAGEISFLNSTISDNTGSFFGAAIHNLGMIELAFCTLANNGGGSNGGAIQNDTSGLLRIVNTIVADSSGPDCTGVGITDLGFNIIEDGSCISHPTSFAADPLLGPLADNGGPTMTHALLPGSPAIDAGDCSGGDVTEDQRGVSRPQGAACDIGAFEAEMICDAAGCPAGTVAIVDRDGDFAGWCAGASISDAVDIYVDAVIPGQLALIEVSKDFTQIAPITLTFQQVCADDAAAVPTIYLADESLTNLTGVDWPDFTWTILGDGVAWFDVAASGGFRVDPSFASSAFANFIDAPANHRALTLNATNGAVPNFSTFFAGHGSGELAIRVDLSADEPVFIELVETSSAIHLLGDFDADGDVDMTDFAAFALCFGGMNAPIAPSCPNAPLADCDHDGDVDLSDFAMFALSFTG